MNACAYGIRQSLVRALTGLGVRVADASGSSLRRCGFLRKRVPGGLFSRLVRCKPSHPFTWTSQQRANEVWVGQESKKPTAYGLALIWKHNFAAQKNHILAVSRPFLAKTRHLSRSCGIISLPSAHFGRITLPRSHLHKNTASLLVILLLSINECQKF